MEQGSEEWLKARIGKITASRLADVLATVKSGESASRVNYRAELCAERMTGRKEETFTNSAMEHGTETEPIARVAYELLTSSMVEQVGLVVHPTIRRAAASPDGVVGVDGLVEIKCPKTATHFGYLLSGVVPAKYIPQMAWQIVCTGRKWCDFVSFDPRVEEPDQLFVVRYVPTDEYLKEITESVIKFDAEVEGMIEKIILRRYT